jgi:hypothetical protein
MIDNGLILVSCWVCFESECDSGWEGKWADDGSDRQ